MEGRSPQRDLHDLVPRWGFGAAALVLGLLGGVLLPSPDTGEPAVPLVGLAILLGWEFVWGGGGENRSRYRPLLGSAIGAAIAAVGMFVIAGVATAPNVANQGRSMGVLMVLTAVGLTALMLWTRHQQQRRGNDDVGLFAPVTPQQQARRERVGLVALTWIAGVGGVVMVLLALVSPAPLLALVPAVPLLVVACVCGYKLYRSRGRGPGPW
jgi:hypothetical protein